MCNITVLVCCISDENENVEADFLEGKQEVPWSLHNRGQKRSGEFFICRSTLNTCSSLKPYLCTLIYGDISFSRVG